MQAAEICNEIQMFWLLQCRRRLPAEFGTPRPFSAGRLQLCFSHGFGVYSFLSKIPHKGPMNGKNIQIKN
jgi:hypothetical protein